MLTYLGLAVAFLLSVARLFVINGCDLRVLGMFVFPPFVAFTACVSTKTSRWTARVGGSFLVLIGLGVILSSFDLLPAVLNQFPKLPRADNRLLSWYLWVYLLYIAAILPPYAFGRSLWHHRRGEVAELSPFVCWFGLVAWLLVMAVAVGAFFHWLVVGVH